MDGGCCAHRTPRTCWWRAARRATSRVWGGSRRHSSTSSSAVASSRRGSSPSRAMRFFFYGTLMDEDVRRAVLGVRALAPVERATLEGWRRVKKAGVSYPVIVRARNHKVDGVLMHGIDRRAHELLLEYEGDE